MATHTLIADTNMRDLTLAASGDTVALAGHTLICDNDQSAYRICVTGIGTVQLLDGGCANLSYDPVPATVSIVGGTEANPLHASGGYGYDLNAAAEVIFYASDKNFCSITVHSATNASRPQFAKVVSASSNTVVLDRDMELQIGDVVGLNPQGSQTVDPSSTIRTVTDYTTEGGTYTVTLDSAPAPIPNAGAQCVLLTSAFAIKSHNGALIGQRGLVQGDIAGNEIGLFSASYTRSNPYIAYSKISVDRLVYAQVNRPYVAAQFGGGASINAGVYVSNSACGNWAEGGTAVPFTANFGRAYCPSLACGYDNRAYTPICGRGVYVGGGDVSPWPVPPFGRVEYVDTGMPSTLYSTLAPTSELVIRTASPETCVIHRAGGIATLVKKGGGDVVMAQAPVASAYQLASAGTDAVWYDQAVTVEAGARLTVAWRAFCNIGAIGGVQILADSPLFGQVAVPMGTADVLAQYTESTPPLGVWAPSRLLSWWNTSGHPVRVWVRGWGKAGTVYSNVQVVKGGAL